MLSGVSFTNRAGTTEGPRKGNHQFANKVAAAVGSGVGFTVFFDLKLCSKAQMGAAGHPGHNFPGTRATSQNTEQRNHWPHHQVGTLGRFYAVSHMFC